MIITADDRDQNREETLLERLQTLGANWSPAHVTGAHRALSRLLGDDAAAEGRAAAVLCAIAAGRDLHVPGQGPPGCGTCVNGWVGEDISGRPFPCPTCRPKAVAQVARRTGAAA